MIEDLAEWLGDGPGIIAGSTPVAVTRAAMASLARHCGETRNITSDQMNRLEEALNFSGYRMVSIRFGLDASGDVITKWILCLPGSGVQGL